MKPRLLEVEAFGPFGGLITIDFDDLAADGLFLIHGRTGAGKTSLLDAICFALYGEVPGVRKSKLLRSHHAAANVAPFVSLEFDAQGGRYRVQRTASWEAPKKRGTGTTTKSPTAALHRIDRGTEQLISNRNTEVTDEVRHLIGLTALQFQQVILLPQGQFEKVLQANSVDREKLFETLFDTLEYKQAEQWLDSEARRRSIEVARLRAQLASVVDEATRRTEDVLAPPGDGPPAVVEVHGKSQPADGIYPDATDPSVLADELAVADAADPAVVDLTDPTVTSVLVERLATASAEADLAADEAERGLGRLRTGLENARTLAQLVTRRSALQAQEVALIAAAPEIATQQRIHDAAEEAERLRPTLDEVTLRQDIVNKVQHRVDADLSAAQQAVANLPFSIETLTALDLTAIPSRSALSAATLAVEAEHTTCTGLRRQTRELEVATTEHEKALQRTALAEAEATEAAERIQRATALLPDIDQKIQASRKAAVEVPALAEAETAAVARADVIRRLVDLGPRVVAASAAHLQARTDALDARDAKNSLMERYLDGISANLAGRLELDVACLVCGSPDHPDPAEPALDAVTDAQMEMAEDQVEQARNHETKLSEAHQELLQQQAVLAAQIGDHPLDLEAADRGAAEAAQRHQDASIEAAKLDGLLDGQRKLTESIEQDRAIAAAAATTAASTAAAAEGLAAQIAAAQEVLSARLGSEIPLEVAITALDQVRESLGRIGEHAESTDDARSKLEVAVARATEEVASSRFATAAEAVAARLADTDRASLLARIRRHETDLDTVTTRLADEEFADLPDDPPDTTVLEEQVAAAASTHGSLVERVALTRAALGSVSDLAELHRKLALETGAAVVEADLYQAVFARCTGRVAPKVPLQRWVLASHLQEVCIHANRRLATMTGGRYQLRVERLGSSAAAQAGLDLRVHDANTNQEREVSSLSGGETFQASLALALGVADSVEAHTGGVRLDALFIDEGFGTLDPDSLELAMDELDGLRAGGRMVGVISHVTTLKERIRLGIEVTPGDDGSTVRVGDIPAQ
ncbi:MAG: SMC family ATPase [Aquihabitans sp.]